MICLRCDNEERFTAREDFVEQEYRGYLLKVWTPVVVCDECGWMTIGNDQIDELLKRTKQAYRGELEPAI